MNIIKNFIFLLLFLPMFTLCQEQEEHQVPSLKYLATKVLLDTNSRMNLLDGGFVLPPDLEEELLARELWQYKDLILYSFKRHYTRNGFTNPRPEDCSRYVADKIMGHTIRLAKLGVFRSTIQKVFRESSEQVHTSIISKAVRDNYVHVIASLVREDVLDAEQFLFWLMDKSWRLCDLGRSATKQNNVYRFFSHYCDECNVQDTEVGITLLWSAVKKARGDFVKIVLEKGVDPNVQDDEGRASLHMTFMDLKGEFAQVREEVYKQLLDHDADMYLPDENGVTPLSMITESEDGEDALIFDRTFRRYMT